ncbi:hypothetical protein D3C86_1586170 [compost metagenome]
MRGGRLAQGDGADGVALLQRRVEVAEEIPAVVRVILPGVFAIEKHRDQVARILLVEGIGLVHEVLGGIAPVPLRVLEADLIGEGLVAEKQRDIAGRALRRLPGHADVRRIARRVPEHTLTAGGPDETGLGNLLEEGGGERTFGGPQSTRRLAEAALMAAAPDVELGRDPRAASRVVGRGG